MEETLISFDTAKLAKEKGFKELTKYTYCEDVGKLENDRYPSLGTYSLFNIKSKNQHPWYISAPTQSLLQKWLRERHNLHVNCMYSNRDDINGYFYGVVECADAEDNVVYETYEEALETGLKQALELIP